jgi:hypothetical protein
VVTAQGGAGGGVVVVAGAGVDALVSGAGSAMGLGVVVRGAEHAAVTSTNPSRVATPVLRIRRPLFTKVLPGSVRLSGPGG